MINPKKPELLAPAGSYEAFLCALGAGADAVYMGGAKHNARIGAKNFTQEELEKALYQTHLYGKKCYITLNTLVGDRELDEVLDSVGNLLQLGADAFIVQDIGLISALHTAFPTAELHSSTQCITHSLDGVRALANMGVKRAVLARELSKEDIYNICRESPIETEVFIHGALCVCHSGACLFSSLVGGRSGNRGECAQPCRLPYSLSGNDSKYPLSLKDLTLSEHLSELCEMGVSSLKIEGRMKSGAYVGSVVRVFRELLDMGRDATESDVIRLERIFSRSGFTDGYYTSKLGANMYGVRRDADKAMTRQTEAETFDLPKIPMSARLSVDKSGAELELSANKKSAIVKTAPPDLATNRPIDETFAKEQIGKLGQTPFTLESFSFASDGDYILPRSVLNEARRQALDMLVKEIVPATNKAERLPLDKIHAMPARSYERYVVYAPHRTPKKEELNAILDMGIQRIYLSVFKDVPDGVDASVIGVALPVIIKDCEKEQVLNALSKARQRGVKYVYAESLSSVSLALSEGFSVTAGPRMNVYNSRTLNLLSTMGIEGAVCSPELTPPMKRDIIKALPTGEILYGRIPLMICENCIMNLRDGCRECSDFKRCTKHTELIDRKGIAFPVYPESFHRCQIYNSVPTFNADREATRDTSFGVVLITDEKNALSAVKSVIQKKQPSLFTRKG